jgi:uroporphyrinogen decarboxylase
MLEAIRFGKPAWVPPGNENVWYSFRLEGNIRLGNWTDHWGVEWATEQKDTSPFPVACPIADPEQIRDYQVPDPDRLVLTPQTERELRALDRSEKIAQGYYSYLLFDRAWSLMGMENFMMALYTHPEECRHLLHGAADYARRVFRRMIDLGVDAVHTGEDLGTQRALMVSPGVFREFILPEYAYCFQDLIAAGKMIHFHSCGCIGAVAGDLADVGVTMLNPLQHTANDLAALKRDTMGRTALWGGVDSGIVMHGTPEQVREETRNVLAILKPGGGYICGPDQSFPNYPGANLDALYDTVREFGRY